MPEASDLHVQEKQELISKDETTVPGVVYSPHTDIYETEEALTVVLEMPGVDNDSVQVRLEKDVLQVEGKINHASYDGLSPVYTEYNIGNFSRSFTLSNKIDQEKISAQMDDGVLVLTLPKAAEVKPRKIEVR